MVPEVLTTDRTKWYLLTPERRKALYALFAALGAIGVAYGGWTAESWEQWSTVAQQVLSVIGLACCYCSHWWCLYGSVVWHS